MRQCLRLAVQVTTTLKRSVSLYSCLDKQVCLTMSTPCCTGENDILLLYLKRSPRSWSFTTYGYYKGSENFSRGLAVLLFLPLLKKIPLRDTTLILAGLVSKAAGLTLLGLARQTWTIFLGRLARVRDV